MITLKSKHKRKVEGYGHAIIPEIEVDINKSDILNKQVMIDGELYLVTSIDRWIKNIGRSVIEAGEEVGLYVHKIQ